MKERMRRLSLFVLSMLPIASIAFAAKSALSIAQIGKSGVTDHELSAGEVHSRGT